MIYPFTEADMQKASEVWGCNCGPSALAFALQKPLDAVRHAIAGFDEKQYTSPTMMAGALAFFKRAYRVYRPAAFVAGRPTDIEPMFHDVPALVRIQWCGPWTKPGSNPRWAYRQTHWICTWKERGVALVFDCNSGVTAASTWVDETVPFIVKHVPRADGEWFPTHIWGIQ